MLDGVTGERGDWETVGRNKRRRKKIEDKGIGREDEKTHCVCYKKGATSALHHPLTNTPLPTVMQSPPLPAACAKRSVDVEMTAAANRGLNCQF